MNKFWDPSRVMREQLFITTLLQLLPFTPTVSTHQIGSPGLVLVCVVVVPHGALDPVHLVQTHLSLSPVITDKLRPSPSLQWASAWDFPPRLALGQGWESSVHLNINLSVLFCSTVQYSTVQSCYTAVMVSPLSYHLYPLSYSSDNPDGVSR